MIIINIDFAISKTDSIKTDTSTGHIYDLDHACTLGFCSFTGTIIIKKKVSNIGPVPFLIQVLIEIVQLKFKPKK
jgi:hypothetical protein